MPYERLDSERAATDAERRDRDRRVLGAQGSLTTSQRRLILWMLGVVAVIGMVGVGLVFAFEPGSVAEPRKTLGLIEDGDTVIIRWRGPSCETANIDRTTVVESAEQVRVTSFVDVPVTECGGEPVVNHSHRVELERAVGDRKLVDGACDLSLECP